jgi:hypothetical protein
VAARPPITAQQGGLSDAGVAEDNEALPAIDDVAYQLRQRPDFGVPADE